ncbi:MAG: Ig-like domain-containing protein [Candidatus Eisenbacteria bacterium]|nr:Ig-like domain-containing protein [Candidatus Eisenbacteria bacterium]
MRDLLRFLKLACSGALVLVLAGCARKMPPSGGPPDLIEPTIVSVIPDSGSTAVDRTGAITIEFSEGMDPRSTLASVEIAPRLDWKARRWSGRKLQLIPAAPLRENQTYTVFVGGDARDWHGNRLKSGRTVPFTTAIEFPPGIIAGKIIAKGFPAIGTYLWCYPDTVAPDSTGRDFDAVGVADDRGDFRITGLDVPGRYRLWAFADLNHNHSFEPSTDLLAPADTTFELSLKSAVATGLELHVTNPRAPGRVKGTVLDTLKDDRGSIRLIVQSFADTTRRLLYDLESSGAYDLQWEPGRYRVRAIRDFDRNKIWKRDEEPASNEIEITVEPGGELTLPVFVLVRPVPAETKP